MTTRPITENGTEMRSAAMRAELDRVLASRVFAKSPRLCALLTYICESSLEGLADELTEQQIGIHVFGRPPGYNLSLIHI